MAAGFVQNKGDTLSDTGQFQRSVRTLLGDQFNFQLDRSHDGKPQHADLTARLRDIGADKVEVDFNGNVIGGSTQIGKSTLKW